MGWDKWSLLGKATGALTSKEKQEKPFATFYL